MLFDLWKSHQAVQEMMTAFVEMLKMDREMFLLVLDVLKGRIQRVDTQADVYRRDIAINRKERAIRKDVVEYLSLHPGGDMPACLVLMSIVKDAERVGDYSKNLLEVAQYLETPLSELRYQEQVAEVADHVVKVVDDAINAYRESDSELARDVVQDEAAMTRRCDALIEQVARSDMSANEAVCTAMLFRFLKRIEAHVSNIASSLVLPVHRLDGRLSYKKKQDDEKVQGPET